MYIDPLDSPGEIPYPLPLHLIHTRDDLSQLSIPPNPTSPTVNAQLPLSSGSSFPNEISPYPTLPDSFDQYPRFDTTFPYIHDNGIYNNPAPQDSYSQPPAPFIPHHDSSEQDMTDPLHSPHYLRTHFNQSPSPISTANNHTTVNGMYSPLHAHAANIGVGAHTAPDFTSSPLSPDCKSFLNSPSASPISPAFDDSACSSFDLL
jgi:hypothetical protein